MASGFTCSNGQRSRLSQPGQYDQLVMTDERGRVRISKSRAARHYRRVPRANAAYNPTRLQPFIRSSTDTRDTSGLRISKCSRLPGRSIHRSRRHAKPPQDFVCRPASRAAEESRARDESYRRWPGAHTAGCQRYGLAAAVRFFRRAALEVSKKPFKFRCNGYWRVEVRFFHIEAEPPAARLEALPHPDLELASRCLFSSGAAFQTTHCWMRPPKADCAPAGLEQEVKRMSPTRSRSR